MKTEKVINTMDGLPRYSLLEFREPNDKKKLLYHYTTADAFFSIMNDLTLRTSSFDKLNDLNEVKICELDMMKNFEVINSAEQYIRDNCRLLCFCQDYKYKRHLINGSNHPAMWAHYTDNLQGVCIVIDKKKFKERNKQILNKHFYKFKSVKYNFLGIKDKKIRYEARNEQDFIKENCDSLFFLKHKDWKEEGEHRLFIMDCNKVFSIEDCIEYIILGKRFFEDKEKMQRLIDLLCNPEGKCYKKYIPDSFAKIDLCRGVYDTICAKDKILALVKECAEHYNDYYEWLCTEQGCE